ncbi:hypothetical protein ACKI2N_032145 [Cupriavidus sp. 30B13]|uniref:hypothetical protein n=1 Tax=Cupriavidus sp. 30B13 TaxID=3384241 RepID=UPI003B915043
MQDAVRDLVKLGPLPSIVSPDVKVLENIQEALSRLEKPVSDEDARALVGLFGPDDCFGLAWSLLHAIETAPGWPLKDVLDAGNGEWISRLKQRAE